MRLIPFGAFQAMLGILFAMTVVLALLCNRTRGELPRFLNNACNFAPGSAEGRNCHVVGRFFQRRRRERRKRWTDCLLACPSVSFDCPQRERGAGVHKWQRREDERVRTPFWTFVRRLSFWQTPTSDDDRQGGGLGVTDTLLVVSVDKYNRQTDWRADSLLCSDCDGIGSWEMRSNLVRAPQTEVSILHREQ